MELCRSCMSAEKTKLQPLFDTENLSKIYQTLTLLDISKSDSLPKWLCIDCVHLLLSFDLFKNQCIDSVKLLNEIGVNIKKEPVENFDIAIHTQDSDCKNGVSKYKLSSVDTSIGDDKSFIKNENDEVPRQGAQISLVADANPNDASNQEQQTINKDEKPILNMESTKNKINQDTLSSSICITCKRYNHYAEPIWKENNGKSGALCEFCRKEFLELAELQNHLYFNHQSELNYLCECKDKYIKLNNLEEENENIEENHIIKFHLMLKRYNFFTQRVMWDNVEMIHPVSTNLDLLQIIGLPDHWVCCYYDRKNVYVYDPMERSLQSKTEIILKKLFPQIDNKCVQFPQVDQCISSIESGFYAIAFAVSCFFQVKPELAHYNHSLMRSHLVKIYETGILQQFPQDSTYIKQSVQPMLKEMFSRFQAAREAPKYSQIRLFKCCECGQSHETMQLLKQHKRKTHLEPYTLKLYRKKKNSNNDNLMGDKKLAVVNHYGTNEKKNPPARIEIEETTMKVDPIQDDKLKQSSLSIYSGCASCMPLKECERHANFLHPNKKDYLCECLNKYNYVYTPDGKDANIEEGHVIKFHSILKKYNYFTQRVLWNKIELINPIPEKFDLIQIIGLSDRWICCHYDGTKAFIYDPLNDFHTSNELTTILKKLFPKHRYKNITFPKVRRYFSTTLDSGVYAIAFAVSCVFQIKPDLVHYDHSLIRPHLLKILETGVLQHFPQDSNYKQFPV